MTEYLADSGAVEARLPPMAIESEQSVLGALLIAGEKAWDRISDLITDSDFYRDDHRKIFQHIRRMCETSTTVDVVTVAEAIATSNQVEQTGGLAYLVSIANATPSAANIAAYAKTIREKARMRALLAFADDVHGIAFGTDSTTAQERIDLATDKLMSLTETRANAEEPRAISDILVGTVDAIEARCNRDGSIHGLPTGFRDIDEVFGGFDPGDLIILAGRPSMGKTAFALNIAEHVAVDLRKPALVFSLEMGNNQLATRALSSIGSIDSRTMRNGQMTQDDWVRMDKALGLLHEAPLFIDQSSRLTASQMRSRAKRQARKTGLSIIIIDYLQLMTGGGGENRHQELSGITKALKAMAKDLQVPVIVLSQLSRAVESRNDKRPMMSDLRESGAIEEDADIIMMMYRDDYYCAHSAYAGMAEVLTRKNRNGPCTDVKLSFEREYSRFVDADLSALADIDDEQSSRKARPVKRRADIDA